MVEVLKFLLLEHLLVIALYVMEVYNFETW
jgi:hypothetical protein